MITILVLLIIFGLIFPNPMRSLLNTSSSLVEKVIHPFLVGLIELIGKVLKKTIQIIGIVINWVIKIIVMLFDRIRF